jgi:hypothetical protein
MHNKKGSLRVAFFILPFFGILFLIFAENLQVSGFNLGD